MNLSLGIHVFNEITKNDDGHNDVHHSQHLTDYFYIISYRVFIFTASRQLRRRVPYAGHLMTPKRLWLNKIPTLCDVVIEFPGMLIV